MLKKKAARVEVNISLALLCWVWIALHFSDIAIFVPKKDAKLQLTVKVSAINALPGQNAVCLEHIHIRTNDQRMFNLMQFIFVTVYVY